MATKSIITDDMEHCLLCGSTNNVERHHIFFGTANRKISDKYKLIVPLCAFHHRGDNSVHRNRELDLKVKQLGQKVFEEKIGSREDFRRLFGKSYL